MPKETGRFRRNKKSVNNCPRCGLYVCDGYQTANPKGDTSHECDEEFIKRSDRVRNASMRRDPDEEAPRRRCEADRLTEGFAMLDDEDHGDDD